MLFTSEAFLQIPLSPKNLSSQSTLSILIKIILSFYNYE